MINGLLAQVYFTVDLKILQSHAMVISPVLVYIIGTGILSNWQTLHIGFLNYEMRAIMMEKNQMEGIPNGRH